MKIFYNPKCSKCRETLNILNEKGQQVEIVEYLKDTPSKEELKNVCALLKIAPEEIIRKGEDVYKENYKGKILSDEQWIDAMVKHPILIERPIVVDGDKAIIGRPPTNVISLLRC